MKAISVKETSRLKGDIVIQGSKNTVLPIMASTILCSGVTTIYNCPEIEDVRVMAQLLECLHATVVQKEHILTIDTTDVSYEKLPHELTGRLRASVLLLGPMLARWKKAEIGMPGGCSIGTRPIDIHIEGFRKMNVDINDTSEYLNCKTFYLQGTEFTLRFPSVGATQNLILAATGAVGRTILRGAAKEPEIIELCNHLICMGVLMEGVGTDVLIIKGTQQLSCCDYCNVSDRIVAGTYLLMAAAVPTRIRLYGVEEIHYLRNVIQAVVKLGVNVVRMEHCLCIESFGEVQGGVYETGAYPHFPTDLQPVLMTVLTKAGSRSYLTETMFENRFQIVRQLQSLGADITVEGRTAIIAGNNRLQGHTVKATDLRQGAALLVAGMMSRGYTTITDTAYIERGYEDIVRDLQGVGVEISYI